MPLPLSHANWCSVLPALSNLNFWVSLCRYSQIKGHGLQALDGMPLRRLVLDDCLGLETFGLPFLPKRLPKLEDLRLSGCRRLNDAGLLSLAEWNLPRLRHVNLFRCPRVSPGGVEALREKLPGVVIEWAPVPVAVWGNGVWGPGAGGWADENLMDLAGEGMMEGGDLDPVDWMIGEGMIDLGEGSDW